MGDVNSFARRSATIGYIALIFIGLILSRPNDFGLNSTAVAGKASDRGDRMGRMNMTISRRWVVAAALSAPAIVVSTRLGWAAPAQTLKFSRQRPRGTIDEEIGRAHVLTPD